MNRVLKADLPGVAANNGQMRFVSDSLLDTDIEQDGGVRFVLVRSNGLEWVPVSRKEVAEIRTFSLRLVGNGRYDVLLNTGEDLTADRSLQIVLGDSNRTLTVADELESLSGLSFGGNALKMIRVNNEETGFELASGGAGFDGGSA